MSRFKRFYIIISAIFVFNSLLLIGLAIGAYIYLMNISSNIAEQKYYGQMLEEKEKILASLEERYESISDDIPLINNTLPEEKESSELISDLNSISKKSGLVFVSVKANTASAKKSSDKSLLQTEKGQYSYEMPISIQVKGSYNKFISFVTAIENYQRLINIKSLDIKSVSNGSSADEVDATLEMVVYLKK